MASGVALIGFIYIYIYIYILLICYINSIRERIVCSVNVILMPKEMSSLSQPKIEILRLLGMLLLLAYGSTFLILLFH